jgi:hypothetical protein
MKNDDSIETSTWNSIECWWVMMHDAHKAPVMDDDGRSVVRTKQDERRALGAFPQWGSIG